MRRIELVEEIKKIQDMFFSNNGGEGKFETFYRITEEGEIRQTEEGDKRIIEEAP